MNQFIAVVFPDEKKAYEGWRAEQKLRAAADAAGERMKRYSEETEAKIQALRDQAKKASADAKSRIDARIAEVRADQKQRLANLSRRGSWRRRRSGRRPARPAAGAGPR